MSEPVSVIKFTLPSICFYFSYYLKESKGSRRWLLFLEGELEFSLILFHLYKLFSHFRLFCQSHGGSVSSATFFKGLLCVRMLAVFSYNQFHHPFTISYASTTCRFIGRLAAHLTVIKATSNSSISLCCLLALHTCSEALSRLWPLYMCCFLFL